MIARELEVGISYADIGIDISGWRGEENYKTICPRCVHTHSPGKQSQKDLSINVNKGTWNCKRPSCEWASGSGLEKERWLKDGGNVSAIAPKPVTQLREVKRHAIKTATPVANPGKELAPELGERGRDFLQGRGIPAEAAAAFGITSHEWVDGQGNAQVTIHFPYYVDGKLVNIKRRRLPKIFTQVKDADKSLYNVDAAEGQDVVVFAEGELDCVACYLAGWVAVSLPEGAPGSRVDEVTGEMRVADVGNKINGLYEEKSWRVMQEAKRIIIATDGDEEGQALGAALIEIFGEDKCWQVEWPQGCKDANEVLQSYGPHKLDSVIEGAHPIDPPGTSSFMAEYDKALYIYEHGYDRGVDTKFVNLNLLWRPCLETFTTISGVPSNGKTTFLFDVFSDLAHNHDWRFIVFSPESGGSGTLFGKLIQNAADGPILPGARDRIGREQFDAAAKWVNDHFVRIDGGRRDHEHYSIVTVPEIIERAERMVLRRGFNALIIDPWNRLEAARNKNQTETEYVAWAINMLTRFMHRHRTAVFVVCHPHKMDAPKFGEDEAIPSPYNIAGSAHWYNMSDVILGIGRKKHGEPRNRLTVQVQKVREEGIYGELGETYLYFDARTRRFHNEQEHIPQVVGSNAYTKLGLA